MAETEHIKLIQGVINRLASNSFLLKGWTVTLVAGLTAFAKADADRSFAWIAVFVVLVFGFLDAYYLALERAYRALYETATTASGTSWSLKVDPPSLGDLVSAVLSPPVILLHGTALAVAAVVVATA